MWLSRARARASRLNRSAATAPGPLILRTFLATARSSRVPDARRSCPTQLADQVLMSAGTDRSPGLQRSTHSSLSFTCKAMWSAQRVCRKSHFCEYRRRPEGLFFKIRLSSTRFSVPALPLFNSLRRFHFVSLPCAGLFFCFIPGSTQSLPRTGGFFSGYARYRTDSTGCYLLKFLTCLNMLFVRYYPYTHGAWNAIFQEQCA